jgi:hypothetical protein
MELVIVLYIVWIDFVLWIDLSFLSRNGLFKLLKYFLYEYLEDQILYFLEFCYYFLNS